jgi:subtilisin
VSVRRLHILIVLAVLVTAVAVDPAAATGDAPGAVDGQRVAPEVLADLGRDGEAFVIAELDVPALRREWDRPSRARAVGAAGTRVVDRLPPGSYRGSAREQQLPFITLQVRPAALEALRHDPEVTRVLPNRQNRPSLVESLQATGADIAAAAGHTGTGRAIAVVDTGVDATHPFLAAPGGTTRVVGEGCFSGVGNAFSRVLSACPGYDPQRTGPGAAVPCQLTDPCRHGTHVAGIAAGARPVGAAASVPPAGVAPGASLVAVQVFSYLCDVQPLSTQGGFSCTTGWELVAFDSDIALALEWLHASRTTFSLAAVNLSLGGSPTAAGNCSHAAGGTIAALRAAGVATVAATGNDGNKSLIASPACVPGVVAVGSTDATTGAASKFSNSAPRVDLLAPGAAGGGARGLLSSVPGSGYASSGGTSMAAPHVAAALAVLGERFPGSTVADNVGRLVATGIRTADTNGVSTPLIRLDAAAGVPGSDAPFTALTPARLSDTRPDATTIDGIAARTGAIGPGQTRVIPVTGRGGVPATGVGAVALNVTATGGTAASYLTVHPTGAPRPLASNLNTQPGQTVPNMVIARIGTNGTISVFNASGSTHVIVDVLGWFPTPP